MDGRARPGRHGVSDAVLLQQIGVAHIDMPPFNKGADAPAGDLLHLQHAFRDIRRPVSGQLQELGDGVAGITLCRCGDGQKVLRAAAVGENPCDLKSAPGNGAGLAKNHGSGLGQDLQAVVPFADNAVENAAHLAAQAG